MKDTVGVGNHWNPADAHRDRAREESLALSLWLGPIEVKQLQRLNLVETIVTLSDFPQH